MNLRLFRSPEAARRASLGGVQRLVELALQKDLGWLQKDLRALSRFEPLFRGFCSSEELQADAFENLKCHLLPGEPLPALTRAGFDAAVADAGRRLPGLAVQLADRLETILKLRQEILRRCGPPVAQTPKSADAPKARTLTDLKHLSTAHAAAVPRPSLLAAELVALLPKGFLRTIPFGQLPHLPRYLKALLTRAERAALNPVKDQERAARLAPYQQALRQLEAAPPASETARRLIADVRWLVEEYKVSLFAQELGTAMPVSPRRLDEHLERIREACA